MPPEIRPELRRLIGNHRPIDQAALDKLREALAAIGAAETPPPFPPAPQTIDTRATELTSA